MSEHQYVGARYVPKFSDPVEWQNGTSYEALTIVTYNNASYTSKVPVPATVGNPAQNSKYWALTGNYNGQVEEYRQTAEKISAEYSNINNPVNILTLGAKNDGSADVSNIINSSTDKFNLFLPAGTYRIDAPITLQHSLIGIGYNRDSLYDSENRSVIEVNGNFTSAIIMGDKRPLIKNVTINMNNNTGDCISDTTGERTFYTGITITNLQGNGFKIHAPAAESRKVYFDNITIIGGNNAPTNSTGVFLENSADCSIANFEIMGCRRGVFCDPASTQLRLTNGHIWCGRIDEQTNYSSEWFNQTVGVSSQGSVFVSNVYFDTCHTAIYAKYAYADTVNYTNSNYDSVLYNRVGTGRCYIANLNLWCENQITDMGFPWVTIKNALIENHGATVYDILKSHNSVPVVDTNNFYNMPADNGKYTCLALFTNKYGYHYKINIYEKQTNKGCSLELNPASGFKKVDLINGGISLYYKRITFADNYTGIGIYAGSGEYAINYISANVSSETYPLDIYSLYDTNGNRIKLTETNTTGMTEITT